MQLHVFPLLARLAMKTDDSSPSMSPMVTHRSAHVTIVLKKSPLKNVPAEPGCVLPLGL